MTNSIRSNFQAHPFHLVSPSPWPIYTCAALLTLTTTGVSSFHGFSNADSVLMAAFVIVVSSMAFWWRDVISEGKLYIVLRNYLFSLFIKWRSQ
jgi:cytochrome c oxidase subunit 3